MNLSTDHKNIIIHNDRDWLFKFNVVKTEPKTESVPGDVINQLLACYDAFRNKYIEQFGGYAEILAYDIPLKYVVDPDWISLLANKDVLFFRLRDKENKIVDDLAKLKKIINQCAPDAEMKYNALGVYYREDIFCCLYFRYHERLNQKSKILRKQKNGKTTITFL